MSAQAAVSHPAPGSDSHPGPFGHVAAVAPGVLLAAGIAALAFSLRRYPGLEIFSPMILAILIGILFRNLIGTPARAHAGVKFTLKRILRFAIILLGLQLTTQQIMEVGFNGVVVIGVTLIATFLFTKWLGRVIGVERKLTELIAAGTSICGASAVIATNTVTQAHDEDVACAVACVTVFGSLAMFLYPVLPDLLDLGPRAYGLWTGASVHEVAQVVAAAYQGGGEAGDYGTIAKLTRVAMLAPMIILLGVVAARRGAGRSGVKAKAPVPYFVLGFIALVLINSVITVPAEPKAWIIQVTTFLLSLSLAAMGLETDIGKLRAKGLRPLLLGAGAWLFIAGGSLLLVKLAY